VTLIPTPPAPLAELLAENASLRAELDAMTRMARLNQDKLRRFDALERSIIGAPSFDSLLATLLIDYKAQFALDAVSLALIDPEHEVSKVLHPEAAAAACGEEPALVLLDRAQELQGVLGLGYRPVLAPFGEPHRFLFEDAPTLLSSVALLPLVHHGRLIGSLNMGSKYAERFVTDQSTDFLERLASVVALCLAGSLTTERLKRVGLTDALTGVSNRRYFESRLQEEVLAAQRNGASLACLFFDADKFKLINDQHGHPVGDEVLRFLARLIKLQLRGSDVLCRYGGEEFVALLPATPEAAALDIAERIRRIVAAQTVPLANPSDLRVTISIGVAMLKQPAAPRPCTELASDLVLRADQALYQAKTQGRNRVVLK
jgi:two-component system, cell cycle response regulator